MGYAEMYVKAFTFIFGVYGIQMLLIPGNMVPRSHSTRVTACLLTVAGPRR